ncbi:MAG: hypothetical protein AB1634_09695 [Thermodesulfobacteriota bacterium]
MTAWAWLWLPAGLALGAGQALWLLAGVRRPGPGLAVAGLLRLVAVGLALVVAALYGGIVPAALGWGVGFFCGVCFLRRRREGS